MKINKITNKGFGLIEIVIVSSVMVLVISALMLAAGTYIKLSHKNTDGIKAGYLLEEGLEAVKIIRDTSWSGLGMGGYTRYLNFQSNTWVLSSTPNIVDGKYIRTVFLDHAFRNASDDFAFSGTLDPDARRVTVTVSWFDTLSNSTSTKSISSYVVNLFDN